MSSMTFLLNANISNFRKNFGIASQNVDMLKRNISLLEKRKINLEAKFKKGTISAEKLNSELGKTNKLLKNMKFASKFHISGQQSFAQAKEGLIKGLGLGSTLVMPMKIAMEFETQMIQAYSAANLLKKASSQKELENINKAKMELKKYTLETSSKSLFSGAQIFKSLRTQMNAGQSHKEAMKSNRAILKYATGLRLGVNTVASIGLNVSSQFGKKAEDMKSVLQDLYAGSKSGNTNMILMGQSFKNVGPAAKAFGMNTKSAAANLAILANSGITGSEAGTLFRAILSRLSSKTGKYKKHLDKLGIQTTDAKGNIKEFSEIYKQIAEKTSSLNRQDKIDFFKNVFGEEHFSKAMALSDQYSKGALEKVLKSMDNAKGVIEATEKAMKNTFSGKLKMLMAEAEAHFVGLFDALKPTTDQFFSKMKNLFAYLGENKETIAKTLPKLASLIGIILAVSGLKFMFSGLYKTLVPVIKAFSWLTNNIKKNTLAMKLQSIWTKIATTATKTFSFILRLFSLTNPIGWIITAIGIVIGLCYTFRKNIANFFSNTPDWLKNIWSYFKWCVPVFGIIELLVKNIDWLWEKISGFFSFVWDIGKAVGSIFGSLFGGLFGSGDKTITVKNKNENDDKLDSKENKVKNNNTKTVSITKNAISKIPQANKINNQNKKNITQNNTYKTTINSSGNQDANSLLDKYRKMIRKIEKEKGLASL